MAAIAEIDWLSEFVDALRLYTSSEAVDRVIMKCCEGYVRRKSK